MWLAEPERGREGEAEARGGEGTPRSPPLGGPPLRIWPVWGRRAGVRAARGVELPPTPPCGPQFRVRRMNLFQGEASRRRGAGGPPFPSPPHLFSTRGLAAPLGPQPLCQSLCFPFLPPHRLGPAAGLPSPPPACPPTGVWGASSYRGFCRGAGSAGPRLGVFCPGDVTGAAPGVCSHFSEWAGTPSLSRPPSPGGQPPNGCPD